VLELEGGLLDREQQLDDMVRQLKSLEKELSHSYEIETELKLQLNEQSRLKLEYAEMESLLKNQIESLNGLLREKDSQLNKSQREIQELYRKVKSNPHQEQLMRTKEQQLKDFHS
jgi:chromosome segregation ATPase